jgi:sterol desaturase/sphingolipid hydroxylase (fatty acid hydroxylase superfamily)
VQFYGLLNHYLHCGYTIGKLEAVLSPVFVMSSKWHNVHHQKGRVGWSARDQTFGEMFTIWDRICGTY